MMQRANRGRANSLPSLFAAILALAIANIQVLAQVAPQAALPVPICDGKPVYMVISGRTTDRERMAVYSTALLGSGLYARWGGYYVNTPKAVARFEGAVPPDQATLIVRFPCMANANGFWNSDLYQKTIRPLRINPDAGEYTVAVYPETAYPPYMAGKVLAADFQPPFVLSSPPAATTTATATTPFPPKLLGKGVIFRRMTIVVSDIERALTLYQDTLGFESSSVKHLDAGSSATRVFQLENHPAKRFVTLSANVQQPEILGMVEGGAKSVRGGSLKKTSAADVGTNALVVLTRGRLAAADRFIAANKLTITSRSVLNSPSYGSGIELAFLDWDGNLVVVVDFD